MNVYSNYVPLLRVMLLLDNQLQKCQIKNNLVRYLTKSKHLKVQGVNTFYKHCI